ncbi:MAG: aldehyde ferredoxin oxidoreductase family protein [SAR324 cluster bacterium]
MGKLLRVDLTQGTHRTEPLPDEQVLRQYVGGIGLGMYLLLRETPPGVGATDPAAPLMFMAGPLAGTPAPSSSNLAVVSLNHDTPFAVATGHTHGYWAAYLKHAGYDGIWITGASPSPVYLWVDDGRVELRDASHLWGKDTRETERLIKRELGDSAKISVACIGPAGEARLHGASIKNDRNHGAHKGSVGAVMGSKRLKAVAVRGTHQVPLEDRPAFVELCEQWKNAITTDPPPGQGSPSVGKKLSNAGHHRAYGYAGDANLVAGKNFTDPMWGTRYAHRMVAASKEWTLTPKESYNCSISCAYDCRINSGPYAGYTASLCGGGENIEGAAAMIGVEDPATNIVLTDYCDAKGIDSSVAGALLGMAYELYNRDVLTNQETGGLELTWGNHEAAMILLDQMCSGDGFGGKVLAAGLKEAARLIGRGAESCVVHIRGGGVNMHDWRPAWSVLLGQVLAGAGVCWQGPGVDAWTTEPDLGYTEFAPGTVPQGKAEAVAKTQIKKLWEDTLGVCWFACWGVKGVLDYASRALALGTGWSGFDREEALAVGERMVNLERVIAVKRGFKPADEFDVSPRLLEAPKEGVAAGKSIAPHLHRMVEEYYRIMGWNTATAAPTQATLRRVGLSGAL